MPRRRNLLPFIGVLTLIAIVSALAGVSTKRSSEPAQQDTVLLPIAESSTPSKSRGDGTGRIINGTKAAPTLDEGSRWRSISMLVTYDGYSIGLCGSTFVARRHLVTAAHCVAKNGVQRPATELFVTNGITDISAIRTALKAGKKPNKITALVPVTAVAMHPSWNRDTDQFDAAVLTVGVDSRFTPTPMVGASEQGAWGGGLGRSLEAGGSWIGGWGDIDYSYKQLISEQLMEASIPIRSDAECASDWGNDFDPASMLCAGILDTDDSYETSNGVDSCQGDSGGPLLSPAADGTMRLTGIVSFGSLCASAYFPGVYTRVDAIRGWVEGITGPASGTTVFPPPTPPAPPAPVVTGGGGAGEFSVTSPGATSKVGPRGATQVAWGLPAGVESSRVALYQGASTRPYWFRAVGPADTSFLLGNANVRSGLTHLCVETRDAQQRCVKLSKAATGPKAAAAVTSATLRRGRLTLRGRVAASTRVVQVKVLVTAGRKRLSSRTMRVRVKAWPRSTSFSTTMRWSGRAPKQVKVVTRVKVGTKWRSFTTRLR